MRCRRQRPNGPDGPAQGGRSARDQGVTLVEVLAATAMMAIVVVPLANAVLSSVRASSRSVENAKVITIAQNAADRVNRAGKSCDYSEYAQAAATNEGWPASSVTVIQLHMIPAAQPTLSGTWVSGACADATPSPLLVQRVQIKVVGVDHGMNSLIEVVKSDV